MSATETASKKARIDQFLAKPFLAQVATADPDTLQPHVVPVWYMWDGESIWISGYRSTRKFKEMARNPLVSIVVNAIDDPEGTRGVLLEGRIELIIDQPETIQRISTEIYIRYLGPEGVLEAEPQEWIHDPENMVARLTPQRLMIL
jgi:PPOX class probable F420-dependent enzyme